MRDLSLLKQKLESANNNVFSPPPAHKIRVPNDVRDELKVKGARFNKDIGWHFVSHAPDDHPLAEWRVGGGRWIEISNIPYDVRDDLKDYGMVSEKTDSGWFNYIAASNVELVELLTEYDALDIRLTVEE